MKKLLFFICILFAINLNAQVTADTTAVEPSPYDVKPSKESKAYSAYREVTIEPTFGLAKVKQAIKKIKKSTGDDDEKVSKAVWDAFSAKEKFTYSMIHPESFSQNCDAMPPIEDEHKKIFAFIPDANYEAGLSERQTSFLKKNKDSVMNWIKFFSDAKKRVGLNFKEAILEMNAKEMIPYLTQFYLKTRKDNDILTMLMLFMKEAKYAPFLKSQMFEKLYGTDASWMAFLVANKANQDLIIKRATEFFNGK